MPGGFGEVAVMSLHPGVVRTDIARYASKGIPTTTSALLAPVGRYALRSTEHGAATQLLLATADPLPSGNRGGYFKNCALSQSSVASMYIHAACALWEASEKATGATFSLASEQPTGSKVPTMPRTLSNGNIGVGYNTGDYGDNWKAAGA